MIGLHSSKPPVTLKRFWKAVAAGVITSIGAAVIMAIGMKTVVAHLLFVFFLWLSCRCLFRSDTSGTEPSA
ncbi:MAG: hypothetical protein EPN69_03330 [Rhodanobacter sp.]|nr:MAG: hypothetical protein EPN71_14950 [Rhodanobacter sp.]TAL97324.1 MAG: hypothetical protein EPN69_03330 [Rhodanobacter sp.]TAM40992.1 MAG: hypothetical protein EPN58_08910 [Rhodanobacter sp.]